jgi:uncharacterized membrane protein YedE/YeeE
MTWVYVALGTIFGFVLSRSGAADYNYVQGMFLFTNFALYGIIGVAVALGVPGLWILKRRGRTITGRPLSLELKPAHRGNIAGSIVFGIGWSLCGMCPAPILVNIGEGKLYAIAALAGAVIGAGVFGTLYDRLRRPFALPALMVGPGEG